MTASLDRPTSSVRRAFTNALGDARFALRLLLRAPLFAVTVLTVLTAGIGATTAMFSIAEALLLRPLPYAAPEELTMVWKTHEQLAREWPASLPDFEDIKTENTTFDSMTATNYDAFSVSYDGKPAEHLGGADVSGDFFKVFRIKPLVGRVLEPDDDRREAAPVCVISAELWRERFNANPSVVGRALTLNSKPFTIVGVAPEHFRFGGPRSSPIDVWVPLAHGEDMANRVSSRGNNFLLIMGRRKPGVTVAQAQSDLTEIGKRLEAKYTGAWHHRGLLAVDLQESLVGSAKQNVLILFGAVVLVFLVVCTNVASLLLARNATRRGEMAARAALGATRSRLVAQLVTESIVIFAIGGAGGVLLAHWLVDFFAEVVANRAWTSHLTIGVDFSAVVAAVGLALLAGIAFGLAPALATARVEPQAVLKEAAAQAGIGRAQRVVRSVLVVAQVAVAFALLAGSGLALRAFKELSATPPGFDPEGLVTGRLSLPEGKYDDDARVVAIYDTVLKRMSAEPGVEGVAANSALPMNGSNSNGWFKIEGRPALPVGEGPVIERNVITPGYFKTMGIPLVRGRDFTPADTAEGRLVTIISQKAANDLFPGEDPIGHRIDLQDREEVRWLEIIGVVGDVRQVGLATPVSMAAYVPVAAAPRRWMSIVVRSRTPDAALEQLRRAVAAADPELALFSRRHLKDRVAESIGEQRLLTILLSVFAASALLLSTMGLFGLISYATSQRTRELGLRMALGSSPEAVVALVVKSGARLVALGLAVGLLGALAVGRMLASRLTGVHDFDPLIYVSIPVLLGVVGLSSCLLPAWRAVRISPAVALRYE